MTTSAAIGEALGRSLVEALGPDCSTAALVARLLQSSPNGMLDAVRLESAPAGAALRVLTDFERRGWVTAIGQGWTGGPERMPGGIPGFLDGAAAMYSALPHDGRATTVVTFPASTNGVVRALPRTGFSYAGLVSSDEAFARIADAAVNTLTVLTPFLNKDGLDYVVTLFQRTRAVQKVLVVRRYGGALARASERIEELARLGVDVRNYTLPLPKGFETFHAKVILADQDLAYVGSANMTRYERRSMELGVLVDGKAARVVASVVRAVEIVAERVSADRRRPAFPAPASSQEAR
ncbi:phospholipase D-like domain-containing protein [Phenylobacterium sp. SCN 70-31]|uniref:phospholipase D-like domain-containing protein n=1 Tax=Phenylobacterium sp. SCN 70-31 TaxID=1660129 RepID=UPI00086DEDCD|nr:phospholipase D-like domain-containing protein [Phenylobacterium sp. SCN 70-31]ODT89093.1 MAG: hypothetical protein ABS78_02520 [Phenylobacterium sp. SCN 70-31]